MYVSPFIALVFYTFASFIYVAGCGFTRMNLYLFSFMYFRCVRRNLYGPLRNGYLLVFHPNFHAWRQSAGWSFDDIWNLLKGTIATTFSRKYFHVFYLHFAISILSNSKDILCFNFISYIYNFDKISCCFWFLLNIPKYPNHKWTFLSFGFSLFSAALLCVLIRNLYRFLDKVFCLSTLVSYSHLLLLLALT